MKNEREMVRSTNASYNKLRNQCHRAVYLLSDGQSGLTAGDMAELRKVVNEINQRFHEYNAYRNAMEIPFGQAKGKV